MRYMITEEMMNSYQKHLVRGEYAQDTIKKYLRDVGAFMTWLDGFAAGRTEEAASDVNTGLSISLDSGVTAQGSCHAADAEEVAPESEVGEGGSWARSAMVDKEGTTGWKAHLTEKGYAPATVNAMLSSLNSFLGYLGWDDCKVKFLKIQRRTFRDQEKELNRAEYGRLLEAAKESGNTRLALLLETVCATGIRVSEVRYVTVEILRQRRADISLKGKVRTILLPGKLCRKLMDYARKKGLVNININTNGTLLDAEMAEMLLDSQISFISIDCDGFSKEVYEKIRVGADRDVTYRNIEYLLKRRAELGLKEPIIEVKVMEMDENRHEVDKIIQYWRGRGAWTTTRRLISWAGMCEDIKPEIQSERVACGNAVGILPITWDGKAVNCVMDVDAQFVCGDVAVESIKDIWVKRNKNMVCKHIEHKFSELPEICHSCMDWAIIGEERFDADGNPIQKNYDHGNKML